MLVIFLFIVLATTVGISLCLAHQSGMLRWGCCACCTTNKELEQDLLGGEDEAVYSDDQEYAAATEGCESPRPETTSSRNLQLSSAGRQMIPFSEIKRIKSIATGAYGTVYSGHWSSGGMTVALKTARKSATTGLYSSIRDPSAAVSNGIDSGFTQEIQFSEGASHRNIVQWCDSSHFPSHVLAPDFLTFLHVWTHFGLVDGCSASV